MIIRNVRLVPLDDEPTSSPASLCDIELGPGTIRRVGVDLDSATSDGELDADGRWAIPGLWDQHVHFGQWAMSARRIDLSRTASARGVLSELGEQLASRAAAGLDSGGTIVGFGFRSVVWPDPASVRELDAVVGDRPAVLISGDAHSAWLSSRALQLVGLPPRAGLVEERDWFDLVSRLTSVLDIGPTDNDYASAIRAAQIAGITGIVDLEFEYGPDAWSRRISAGVSGIRVRTGVYPDDLERAAAAGLGTGDLIRGLVTMGPLKIISDGALGTRTAYCCEPYADATGHQASRGTQNYTVDEVANLLARARECGLESAVHAIGDAALRDALTAFERTGATGSIEHAQLARFEDFARMARIGVRASVQPAHLLDDRDIASACWGDRLDRCYAFASMQSAGVELALGSDAPVAALDPWLAIDAAVRRTGDDREPWSAGERLTRRVALAASIDRQRLRPGARPDVVLLDADPLDEMTDIRLIPVAATVVDGSLVHSTV